MRVSAVHVDRAVATTYDAVTSMAVISVEPVLRAALGDDATESLGGLLRQIETEQRADLIDLVEERFARRIAEMRDELRSEMHAGFLDLQKQIGALRADFGKEIADLRNEVRTEIAEVRTEIADVRKEVADVRKELVDVRKEITVQTRWILVVLVGASVLIPVVQRIMEGLLP